MKVLTLLCLWVVLLCGTYGAHEDSLRSALSAVDKRQRYLNRYGDDVLSAYSFSGDNNLEFLKPEDNQYSKVVLPDQELLNYDDDSHHNEYKLTHQKTISSPFRERIEEDRERQREQLAKLLLNSINNENDDGVVYGEIIDDFIDKHPKRSWHYYYNNPYLELASKRINRIYRPESHSNTAATIYALSYLPRSDVDDKNPYFAEDERNQEDTFFTHHQKRFPVSKRSNTFYNSNTLKKRSPNSKELPVKTDPKVEKELSHLFGTIKNKTKSENKTNGLDDYSKEVAVPPVTSKTETLGIKKKSIDWSDYFGLDRRKKSDNLDKEWLMERYHKAVSMTAKRSTSENLYPQRQEKLDFKDVPSKTKIKEIDEMLKEIEDSMIDDALKYTGSHQGVIENKQHQKVKDYLMAHLSGAYKIEKIRDALGANEEDSKITSYMEKPVNKNFEDLFPKQKRVSVPRKQAVDEEAEKPRSTDDNNIKCKGENCDLQNFRTPSRVLDQFQWGVEECPKIQRECSDLATSTGNYGHAFEMACSIHQLCLLCDDNSNWFTPTVKCNALYLSKVNEICDGNTECLKVGQYFLENLLLLDHSLRDLSLDGCNLICPENER